ncbi:hypothetical protein BDZ89DRAFT_1058708 [Hymenopellis radicata]|nr:hypothetical protein BDZ89DRAFT_1058708 [Hymenopellis radicata]
MDAAPCNKFSHSSSDHHHISLQPTCGHLTGHSQSRFCQCQRRMRLPDREILATNGSGSRAAHIPTTPPSNYHQLPSWACLLPVAYFHTPQTIVVQYVDIMSSLYRIPKYICSERL